MEGRENELLDRLDALNRKIQEARKDAGDLRRKIKTIEKRIADIMEGAHAESGKASRRRDRVAEAGAAWGEVTPENLGKAIADLEKQMFRHAELLEFEEAARVRDRIGKLKAQVLKAPGMP